MSDTVFLEGDRITLRPIADDDVPFRYTVKQDRRVWPSLFVQHKPPYTERQVHAHVEQLVERDDVVALTVCVDDEAVGAVTLSEIDGPTGTAEVSYWLDPEVQGNGYATEAVSVICSFAFDQLRLHKLRADVYAFNEPSRTLLDRLGFVEEGVFRDAGFVDGTHEDVVRYGLIAGELDSR